jgi:hypothetical protein
MAGHAAGVLFLIAALWALSAQAASDDEVRKTMTEESISHYRGNCPCPDNRASNGSRCGARSSYSKSGTARVFCYPTDISQPMVDAYRKRNAIPK